MVCRQDAVLFAHSHFMAVHESVGRKLVILNSLCQKEVGSEGQVDVAKQQIFISQKIAEFFHIIVEGWGVYILFAEVFVRGSRRMRGLRFGVSCCLVMAVALLLRKRSTSDGFHLANLPILIGAGKFPWEIQRQIVDSPHCNLWLRSLIVSNFLVCVMVVPLSSFKRHYRLIREF